MIPNKHLLTALLWWLSLVLVGQAASITLPSPDLDSLARADALMESQRFAAPLAIDIYPSAGTWTSNNGVNGVWQLTIELPTTRGLAIYLDQLNLPAGSQLKLQNSNGVRGPFMAKDVSANGRLFTGFLPGNTVTLTYRGTVFADDESPFHLWRADHAYRSDLFSPRSTSSLNYGASNDCQINANCPEGDGYDDEKNGVARVIAVAEEGSFYCSGSLINNTAEDGRPLFLTAYHCQEGVTALYDLWRFDFGYRSISCVDPVTEPGFTSYNGSLFRAGREESDVLLLEIVDPDFDESTHYFNGWNRADEAVASGVGIHHPVGDIQKVSTSTFSGLSIWANSISWENIVTPPNHHLRMIVAEGTAEIGSSGSPVFDPDGNIRGQLHGGTTNCPGSTVLFYGRIFQSWTGGGTADTRLSDWLDPLGLEPEQLNGTYLQGNGLGRILRGNVNWLGQPIEGARLIFDWGEGTVDTIFSDAAGNYQLVRPQNATSVNISTNYEFGGPLTGVNVTDIIALRRHILGIQFLDERALVAADVTNNGVESVGDIVRISQVILSLNPWEFRPNWLVYPSLLPLEGLPNNIFGPFDISIPNPAAGIITLDFEVSKNGDVDENAF